MPRQRLKSLLARVQLQIAALPVLLLGFLCSVFLFATLTLNFVEYLQLYSLGTETLSRRLEGEAGQTRYRIRKRIGLGVCHSGASHPRA